MSKRVIFFIVILSAELVLLFFSILNVFVGKFAFSAPALALSILLGFALGISVFAGFCTSKVYFFKGKRMNDQKEEEK